MKEEIRKKINISGFADEISPDLEEQIRVLTGLGISYVEMRGVNGKGLVDYSLNDAEKIKRRLEESGIRLSSVGSPIGKIPVTESFEEHFELFKHTVEIAKIMDTPYIRMFSFFIPKEENTEKYEDVVFKRVEKMVEHAAKNNVILLHENEKDIYGDVAVRCKKLMEKFYGDNFKAVFDFANFVQCHQDTKEAFEMLKPFVEYIHVKDAVWKTGEVVPAGYGDGNVKTILTELFGGGYHGFLSLEPHLADFAGFSALENGGILKEKKLTGEEAFTLAFDSLQKILDEI
ncbi:MAG: sugar phosphate isomerase/epimerase [Butyrivibrio sp.]|nr:sugar phosphate isomerase/epimerase [Butyrivibrio sp.]